MIFKSELQKQIDDLKKEIDLLKNVDFRLEIEKIKTHIVSLRGLINRKLKYPGDDEEGKEYKDVIIPEKYGEKQK